MGDPEAPFPEDSRALPGIESDSDEFVAWASEGVARPPRRWAAVPPAKWPAAIDRQETTGL